ncbi:MAG: sterol desaturase family protein [Deltaproteobacteria bacterium]|jgi:sterol desaturase/sphingolipid hydroxylase (fatty acid hydroxylase superfamily)|nr:sterol desaturase family protein [Deltaproteobacteria bacterium]MBW2530876.1 sterol desaturase family protein [Deltaproteobacteria bacterium]
MLGIPLGLLYANAGEWVLHRYVLHRLGRNKQSFWRFHWLHHGQARRHDFRDPDYERSVFGWHAQGKEALSMLGLGVLHLPLFPVAPWFTATALYCAYNYYRKHKRAHLDPEWAKAKLRWHVDHHLGKNPEANYCVTQPWFDHLVGTREPMPSGSEG